jgi:hypothetical protein
MPRKPKSPDDADDDIADDTETAALHDDTGQPACNRSDNQEDDDACQVHNSPFPFRIVPGGGTRTKRIPEAIGRSA